MHREVIIYIINNKKEILLQKRSSTKKHHPNKWALCSGHVEDFDEDFETAAVRELNEELGLIISKEELELVFVKEVVDDSKDKHITKYYVLHTDKNENDFVLQKEELSEVKWYEITKVIDMMENKSQDIVFSDSMLTILKSISKDI